MEEHVDLRYEVLTHQAIVILFVNANSSHPRQKDEGGRGRGGMWK